MKLCRNCYQRPTLPNREFCLQCTLKFQRQINTTVTTIYRLIQAERNTKNEK